MAGNKKPRKPHRVKRKIVNTMEYASILAGVLGAKERALLIDPVKECFDRLRKGEFTNAHYRHLRDVFNIAEALTEPGTGIFPDHVDKFIAAQAALHAVGNRRAAGGSWTCYADELAAIATGLEFHEHQLKFASAGDMTRATIKADQFVQSTRKGSTGKKHFHTILAAE